MGLLGHGLPGVVIVVLIAAQQCGKQVTIAGIQRYAEPLDAHPYIGRPGVIEVHAGPYIVGPQIRPARVIGSGLAGARPGSRRANEFIKPSVECLCGAHQGGGVALRGGEGGVLCCE